MTSIKGEKVSGSKNLEVMEEALNYNDFLLRQVREAMTGCECICDFGAGRSTFALPLSNLGYKVVCVEPEPGQRSALIAAGLEAHPSLAAVPPNSLDGIYALNVLEHIEDDCGTLEVMHDRLREGGRLYIYVPAFQVLFSAMDHRVGHLRRYRLGELVDKCRRASFTVEKSGYCDSLGFFASLVYKAVGPNDGTINRRSLAFYDRYCFPLSRGLDMLAGSLFGKNAWLLARRSGLRSGVTDGS